MKNAMDLIHKNRNLFYPVDYITPQNQNSIIKFVKNRSMSKKILDTIISILDDVNENKFHSPDALKYHVLSKLENEKMNIKFQQHIDLFEVSDQKFNLKFITGINSNSEALEAIIDEM